MSNIKEIDNIQDKLNWHWRNSMRTVRFLGFDARAAIMLPVLLFYARPSTLFLTFLVLMFFRQLERIGLTFPAAMRAFRASMVGKDRPGWISAQHKQFKDLG